MKAVVIKLFSKLYEDFNISAFCHLVIDKEVSHIVSVYSVPYFVYSFQINNNKSKYHFTNFENN